MKWTSEIRQFGVLFWFKHLAIKRHIVTGDFYLKSSVFDAITNFVHPLTSALPETVILFNIA